MQFDFCHQAGTFNFVLTLGQEINLLMQYLYSQFNNFYELFKTTSSISSGKLLRLMLSLSIGCGSAS